MWQSAWEGKYYQVYVNGRYAGTAVDGQQRKMIVQIPTSFESPVRIEVFAVEPEHAAIDLSSEIESSLGQSGRVRIDMLRGQSLPIGATARIYFDNGSGEISYSEMLNDSPIRTWPACQDKAGFGMSTFGAGDFGYDSAAAAGFGRGSFAHGQFGLDADTMKWTSPALCAGNYKFAVKVVDEVGNESNGIETGQITVIPAPRPAEQVSITSFDKQTNELVLAIS
ncbi:MAG: hypothetical protein AMJ75_00625 [Phycisphaerae bacterium SM1_79]|nr:MAG: hypothetical protein AMJ75_00625 [Phycisphaerae bacterium SM1_79]